MWKRQGLMLVLAVSLASTQGQAAQWSKASDWLGMTVVTSQGDRVGQVEDFALDLESGELGYLVVSVGSFLIEDALIAVSPKVLLVEDERLVIASDGVANARRFGPDAWPEMADIVADADQDASAGRTRPGAANAGDQQDVGLPSSGVATISSNRRTATLSAGERQIQDLQPSQQSSAVVVAANTASRTPSITRVPNGPLPKFGSLDKNRNGVLTRREIGAWLRQDEGYAEIDLDSSGTVDRFEFDIFSAQRKR